MRPKPDDGSSTTQTGDNSPNQNQEVAEEPAVERGERMSSAKAIARGGKSTGKVPGATENEQEAPEK
jgi:hypothetical protein